MLLELGYFMAKLGRQRVAALVQEGVEVPTDILGVGYIPLDQGGAAIACAGGPTPAWSRRR